MVQVRRLVRAGGKVEFPNPDELSFQVPEQ